MFTKEQGKELAEAFNRAVEELRDRVAVVAEAWNRAVEKASTDPTTEEEE